MSLLWPRWPMLLAALLTAGPAAASGTKLAPVSPSTLTRLKAQQPSRATESLSRLRAQMLELGLNGRDDFQLSGVLTDAFGLTHARFQQLHQGVPVWGAAAITHMDASGKSLPVTADGLRLGVRVGVTPSLDMRSAISLAVLDMSPQGLMGAEPTAELVVYPETHRVNLSPDKPFKEQNAADFKQEVAAYHLAWHVHVELDNERDGVAHKDYLLDAQSGQVLKQWNSLQTAAAVGVGRSQYSGQVPLDVWQNESGQYELRDTTRVPGMGLRTLDVNHANVHLGAPSTPVLYTDADNTWGDGLNYATGAPTLGDNGQTAAVDAHYGLLATWDYYQTIHDRFGIDGVGTPTFNRMHVGTSYNNAFWNSGCFCMSYGDGSFSATVPTGFKTMTALDVTGHELSHGVMSETAGLIYAGESGGLNESNSDIFGTMTEFWVRGGRKSTIGNTGGNWNLAEDLNPYFSLRYMYKPSLDGLSPDAWYPGIENIDVHQSSGPMNRAFYFLSVGATPAAGGGDTSSDYLPAGMTGIGNDAAAAIWYRAITIYLFPSSNYVSARTATLQAAADLYGATSAQYHAVENAFAAINVGYTASTYDDRLPPTLSASVSGSAPTLLLNAVGTDNVGITRVEFYADGTLVGADVSLPFQLPLDTTQMANGAHQLVAVAFDKAGNVGVSPPILFNVANSFTQLLQDPGFELAGEGWEANPRGNINYPVTGARTGQGYVWLNGYGAVSQDNLYQDVAIPAGASRAALTFYLLLTTKETGSVANDSLVVQVRNTSGAVLKTLATFSNLDATLGWVQRSFDLTEFAGQTVRIYLEGTENASLATDFKFDDFTLRVLGAADTEPPAVTASTLFNTPGTQVGLFANVSDNGFVGAVEFILDGTSLGTTATSFARTLAVSSLSNGTHTVVAKATDAAGNVGQSAPVTFVVDTNRAQRVSNPSFEDRTAAGFAVWPVSTTRSGSGGFYYVATGNSFAHTGLTFFIIYTNPGTNRTQVRQTVTVPADSTSAIYSFWLRLYSSAYADGVAHHTFKALVVNAAGSTILQTLKTFSNLDDTGGTYYEHRFDLSAYKGQTIQLFFDADLLAAPQIAGGVTQIFLDDVTLTTTSTADTRGPDLSAFVEGTYGDLKLNATVSDNVWTSKLEFFVDGGLVATRTSPNGSYVVPFNASALSNGVHEYKAVATDTAGNVTTRIVNFILGNSTVSDTAAPTLTTAVDGELASAELTAIATDDTGVTQVEFYVDNAFQGRILAPPYRLPFNATPLSAGTHTLKAVAHDAYGHSATATASFTREGVTLTTDFITVAVGETHAFTPQLEPAGATALTWRVDEGGICGGVSSSGVYQAPSSGSGLCHVSVALAADPSTQDTATVKVYSGDLNGDHVVDGEDLGLLAQAHGAKDTAEKYTEQADLDSNAHVDDADVTLFVTQFGR